MQGKKQKTERNKRGLKPTPVFVNLKPCALNLVPAALWTGAAVVRTAIFVRAVPRTVAACAGPPKKTPPKKLSMAEQIALYERINKKKIKRKK